MSLIRSSGRKAYRTGLHAGLRCVVAAALLGVGAAQALAQCSEEQKLTASDAAPHDRFGHSVSVSGETAVVGASLADCAVGASCGAAYVFRYDGTSWVEVQKLTASDAARGDGFGVSISVSGDTAVVGAGVADCAAGDYCGTAYVFRFDGTTWVEEQKLAASDAAENDKFGWSVTMSGATVIVGARGDDCDVGHNCGSAYVFRFNGTSWVEEQKLTASDAARRESFGRSVSVDGDRALVGALHYDFDERTTCGSVYAFRFDGTRWVEEQKLATSDAAECVGFGGSISLNEDTALVTASGADCAAGDRCGSAYVFRFNGNAWVEEQRLTASDAAEGDAFGRSVSVSGDTAVVGAYGDACAAGERCGSAYVFGFDGTDWVEQKKLIASDAETYDRLGTSVSVDGDTVMVGAAADDCEAGSSCGSAYVFSCSPAPTIANLDIKPGSCPNAVNPRSKGVMPVALVGSAEFDVTMVDLDSLTLSRVDGVGGSVSPLTGPRGPRIDVEDVATPLDGELCDCHELEGDGIDDLTLKFSTVEMARALELGTAEHGETVELVLRGSLFDETTFEASDCIVIRGKHNASPVLRRNKR